MAFCVIFILLFPFPLPSTLHLNSPGDVAYGKEEGFVYTTVCTPRLVSLPLCCLPTVQGILSRPGCECFSSATLRVMSSQKRSKRRSPC